LIKIRGRLQTLFFQVKQARSKRSKWSKVKWPEEPKQRWFLMAKKW